jgi:hypothetical protein
MSLEDAIAKLTASVDKQNGLLEKMLAGAKAPAATTPAAAGAKAPAAGAKAPAAGKKTEAPKAPSVTVISTRFGNYMKNEATRDEALGNVRALVAHYGAPKLTEIDAKHFPKLLEYLDTWEAGGEVEFEALEDDGSGDDGEGAGLL